MSVANDIEVTEGLCDFAKIPEETPEPPPAPEPMALLPPDHPLLRKFQQSLREHLLRTKQKLENEIAEIKCEVKAKEQRREEQGLSLYEMQQKIVAQGEQIREITTQIDSQVEKRTNEEKVVATLKQEYEEKIKLTKTEKIEYNKLMVELEDLQTLGSNIKKWAHDVEDEVKNAKRIVSRDAQLQKQLSEEKRKSDILFYRLNTEVKKREAELANICEEETAMTEVINILNMSIANANTDLEALQSEHKRLTQAWSEVIIAIQLRDKILFQVTENLRKLQESIKLNTTGIDAIKKQINKEMELNRKLEAFKQRLAEDFNSLKRDCQRESDTLAGLQAKLEELPIWLSSTEKDLQEAAREGTKVQNELRRLNFKLDKQHFKKFQIEEEILKLAQDQLITDKASSYRLKLLNKSQEQRRKMDVALAKTQNQLSTAMVNLERMRGQLFNIEQENNELQSKLDAAEAKSDRLDADLKDMHTQIEVKMKRFEKINQKIEQATKDFDDSSANPTEIKIKQTEKLIHNAEQQIREHQQFWIMLQNHFVNLTQKRNDQLNEIQVTRKQLSIIMQKSLKIDQDLEVAEARMKELNINIQKYVSKLELLNERIFKKRQQHENEESFCEIEHFELTKKLKENEMNILVIEGEIDDITMDIELHKDLVLDKHREALSWETKYKLIEETIRWHKTEQSLDSDINLMKTEIHRMNIRYNQLRRAQEKLVQDLEHCVMHREQIFFSATVKEHVDTKFVHGTKHAQTQMKLQDLRNKIKIVDNDMAMLSEKRLKTAISDIERIEKIMLKTNEDLKQVRAEDENLRAKIDECVLLKHANLELIVRKQNRAKSYRKLLQSKSGALKTPRSEAAIKAQTQKQTEMNDILVDVLQTCINEFPDRKAFFIKLLHVVKD